MTAKKRIANLFVVFAFFLSGAIALVYEILWSHYLSELIGSSSLATVVVLMVFLGGLSFGSIVAGWLVDRWRNGLIMYGCLELVIGLYAVLFPVFYKQANEFFLRVGSNLEFGSFEMFLCKFLVASLLILLPSIAMGGTLPAVTRYLTLTRQGVRRNVSTLYGLNTLGGVLGVLVAGFYLIHQYGLANSMLFAGIMNLVLGIMALIFALLNRRMVLSDVDGDNSDRRSPEEFQDSRIFSPYTAKRAFFAAGVGGFAAMALQVAWIRYFSIVLGATHNAFTIVVAAFICGLGLGALMVRTRKFGSIPLPTSLALAFALTTAAVGIGLFFYARVPFEIGRYGAIIVHTPYSWPFHEIVQFGFCFILMLLPTVFSGMLLPICIRIVGRGSEEVGWDVGKIYAVNTLGGLLGIMVTSQLLFRIFPLSQTLQIIFLIYVGATFFLAFILKEEGRKRLLVATSFVLFLNVFFWRPWSPQQLFLNRVNFNQNPPLTYAMFSADKDRNAIVGTFHGSDAQVIVYDYLVDNSVSARIMTINGKSDASIHGSQRSGDMETQVMTAHIPMLLHADPEKVFVLGLGSGVTTGEVLNFPEVKQAVTAELVGEVFEGSKLFAEYNNRFWENPRHRMVIEDGKTFLRLAEDNYDVIIAQPTNVWQNGMARLYSEEFFRLAKSRLKTKGVFAQWLHTYEVDDVTVDVILKTFSLVFPKASVFEVSSQDLLLIGYDHQWQFDPQQLMKRFNYRQIRAAELQNYNASPLAVLIRETMGREDFHKYTSVLQTPINSDDFLVLEKIAEYGHFLDSPPNLPEQYDSRVDPDSKALLIHEYLNTNGIDLNSLYGLILSPYPGLNERLRLSMVFMMNSLLENSQMEMPPVALRRHLPPQLREIVMHPNYRKPPEQMTAEEAYQMFGGELLVWSSAASQLWTPDQGRLYQLYDRLTPLLDEKRAATLARNSGVELALGRIYTVAQHFFRIAEEKGVLTPELMSPDDIGAVFSCTVREGETEQARYWWSVIERNQLKLTAAMQQSKNLLELKLGNPLAGAQQAVKEVVIQQI